MSIVYSPWNWYLCININTIPVLDVLKSHTNKIIGNRSFSKDKKPNIAISKIAQTRIHFVKQAINENKFTKDEAIKYLDVAMWL